MQGIVTGTNAVYEPLTRDNATLVLIDLQVGPLSTIRTIEQQELKQNSIALATITQMYSLPAVFAAGSQSGPGGAYMPELLQLLPEHKHVIHSTTNVWQTPAFPAAISQLQRKNLVMAGIATDIGLLFAVLSARSAGFNVYIVTDVCGTLTQRSEQAAFMRMMQAGAIMSSWASLAAEIQRDFTAEHGRRLLEIINKQLALDA